MANNVDIAKQHLRQLQQKLYDYNVSTNELNKFLEQVVMPQMDKASQEIATNYKDISEKLTAQLNTGRPQE
jgi:cytochrome c553